VTLEDVRIAAGLVVVARFGSGVVCVSRLVRGAGLAGLIWSLAGAYCTGLWGVMLCAVGARGGNDGDRGIMGCDG
jgi:hypothetical protein